MKRTIIFKKPATIPNKRSNYKNLIVWELAYSLVLRFYGIIDLLPDHESKNIADQMRRAITSLPLNIAEGASSRYKKVFCNHLNYAYGSAREVDVLLMLCHDLNYISLQTFDELNEELEKFKCHIFKLIVKIEKELSQKQNWKKQQVSISS